MISRYMCSSLDNMININMYSNLVYNKMLLFKTYAIGGSPHYIFCKDGHTTSEGLDMYRIYYHIYPIRVVFIVYHTSLIDMF